MKWSEIARAPGQEHVITVRPILLNFDKIIYLLNWAKENLRLKTWIRQMVVSANQPWYGFVAFRSTICISVTTVQWCWYDIQDA